MFKINLLKLEKILEKFDFLLWARFDDDESDGHNKYFPVEMGVVKGHGLKAQYKEAQLKEQGK